ncbi:MAG: PKD domain-containing protein [Candidatus Zapsychrus exili]|nr:PKD domain-containing protein [Candidatus Zapsychrus exili]
MKSIYLRLRSHNKVLPVILFLLIAFTFIINPSFAQEAQEPLTSSRCNQFTFDATGSYDPDKGNITFFWDFGDGDTSTEPVANHTYKKSGDYNVALTVADNSGMECSTAITSNLIRANIPPHVSFSAPEMICVNQTTSFDGSTSYADNRSRLNYIWDFGDGTTVEGDKVTSKSYTKGGNYKVSLLVDDNAGTGCSTKTTEKFVLVNEPPVADAGDSEVLKCMGDDANIAVDFDASNSTDANNDKLEYTWYFGDGNKADGAKVTHQYSDVGNYDAKLVVKDNTKIGCGTSVGFVTVRINKAPAANAGEDIITCPGESINFDGSESSIYKKGTVSATWNFGDGQTANTLKTSHSYANPGKYQANLSLENKLNNMCPESKDTRAIAVNSRPTVTIKSPSSVCLGKEIGFDASSATDADGNNLEYYWSFGDGTVLRGGAKAVHTYEQGGDYRVTVIVDDKQGSNCSTATAKINIKINTPPVADAGPNTSCCVDKEASFDASASTDPDGDKLTYTWDFGDGTTEDGAITKHIYSKSGSYNVSVTVDDGAGTSCSKSSAGYTAETNSTPVPIINIR